MFKSSGPLIYISGGRLIVRCCDQLAKYYRKSLRKKVLAGPAFGAHITVINTKFETPKHMNVWEKYSNESIEFMYDHYLYKKGSFYGLHAMSPRLMDIRHELGVPPSPYWGFHITIAKEKE